MPLDNIVGKDNTGPKQTTSFLNENRIVAAARSVGFAQGAFDRSFRHVKDRVQFGRKIIDFQATRQKIANMATQIEAARILTYQAAWNFDHKRNSPKLSAMAQLQASTTAVLVCDEAIQLLGGYGYIQENEVERYYRDAKMDDIFDGSKIVQRDIIADELVKSRRL